MGERTREIAKEYLEHYKRVKYGMMPEWVWDMAIKALEQEPKSEWEHDHEILKAYSDGANGVLDKIRAEIEEQVLESLSDGGDDWFTAEKVNECLDIIDKYKAESEEV